MSKLTVVVTCTNRKKLRPAQGCSIRDLPVATTVAARADIWLERIASAKDVVALRGLYKGDAWRRSLDIERAARAKGFAVEMLVASAGLGLRALDETGPSYGATFSSGHPDSVGSGAEWWQAIAGESRGRLLRAAQEGALMFVVSTAYGRALEEDMRLAAREAHECLIVGGARDIEGATRITPPAALSQELGGALSSLNQRAAREWIERLEGSALVEADALRHWYSRVGRLEPRPVQEREPISDAAVREFVRQLHGRSPRTSRTRALRNLRDAGFACEQSRFARLFDEESRE